MQKCDFSKNEKNQAPRKTQGEASKSGGFLPLDAAESWALGL